MDNHADKHYTHRGHRSILCINQKILSESQKLPRLDSNVAMHVEIYISIDAQGTSYVFV